jgi:spermidine synthase
MHVRQRLRAPMLLLFFLSGMAGLVYQIVWTRLLVLVFGNTLLATSTVVTAYMAGLAAGSYALGRAIDARPRPLLKLYALLEAGIGAFALLFPLLVSAATPLYAALHRALAGNVALLNLARFAVCFGLILVPTFLMGGTLPVLLKRFGRGGRGLGPQAGLFYGLNTAGAVIGCLATGYVLLGLLGMRRTTWLAVGLNLGVAVAAWLLSRAEREETEGAGREPAPEAETPAPAHDRLAVRAVLAGTGLSGFCALAYELLWTRMLNLFLNNNVYSFTAVLATFLAGIALGSLVYSTLLSGTRRPVALFAALQLGIALWAWATPFLFGLLQGALFSRQSDALTLAKTSVVMIAPTVLMGIALPLAVGICRRGPRLEGTTVGTVYAVNTVGSILGSFAAGFVLVPHVGLHRGLVIVVGLNLLAAALAATAVAGRRTRPAWALGFVGLVAASVLAAPATLFRDLYERAQPSADVLLYQEGRIANVVVYDFHKSGYKDLYLNAIEEASSRLWHVQLFKMLGILPVMVHDHPANALMIAFGAGMSAGATVGHVASLEVVDLNPDVSGVAEVFAHENLDVLHAPGLHRVVNDGRNALLLRPGRYSVIISDATNPKTFDSWTLYTREFYSLVRSRLEPDGVFCQWFVVPLPGDAVKVLLATFREVFPHASLWCVYGSSQCMMLATPERLSIDHAALTKRMGPVWQASGLAEFGIADTDKFLSYLLLGEDELGAALRGVARVNTDDLPYAQFQVGQEVEGVRAFLDLLEHQASLEPYLTGAGPASRERLEAYRSLSRRLHLGFLLNSPGEVEVARAFAARAGLGDDENVRSGLLFDSKRKESFLDRVARHERDANARNSLGYVFWREGRLDPATRELERAVELAPRFASARANLARVHRDAGRYDEAEKEWLEVRRLNPARDVLPMVRRELDLLHLLRKLRYEPRSVPLLLALSDLHARAGSLVEAAEAARAAAAASPADPAVLLKRASLCENLEFVDEALEAYRALAKLVPREPQVARKVAEFEVLARDRSARQQWLNANEIVLSREGQDEGHPEACRRAFRLWGEYPFEGTIDRAALARAASLFEEAVAERRDHMHAYADAARIHEALGQYARAAELWRRGLEAMPGDRAAENERRRLELLARLDGEGPGADRDAAALAEAGRLHGVGGETESAIELLRRAVAAQPGRAEAWRDLAAACVDAGRYPEAIQALEHALGPSPAPPDAEATRQTLARLKQLVGASGTSAPR